MRTAIAGTLAAVPLVFAPAAFAGPTGNLYTIDGDISILIAWGPGNCIQLNWPTASEPICNQAHAYVGHQYNVLPGQVIGVDPDISGTQVVSCSSMDDVTGEIVWRDSGTFDDGQDINRLANTYGRNVESQGHQ